MPKSTASCGEAVAADCSPMLLLLNKVFPKRPSDSLSGPAVKYSLAGSIDVAVDGANGKTLQ